MKNLPALLSTMAAALLMTPSQAVANRNLIAQRGYDWEEREETRTPIDKRKVEDNSGNMTWHPIGFNENRIAVSWVQLKSYEPLNENSFRMNFRWSNNKGQWVGRIDMNCKNKDFYVRQKGVMFQGPNWASIPEGSGLASIAILYCKQTTAASEWGYTENTRYLWDIPAPTSDPGDAQGDWILATDNDMVESYYNSEVEKEGDYILASYYYRTKKGDRSAAQPQDNSKYTWTAVSCKKNLYSSFQVMDQSVPGVWLPPMPGRPGGGAMAIRKSFC